MTVLLRGGHVALSDWQPGYRHQVRGVDPTGWECVDCGSRFDCWPDDGEECPGPPERNSP